MVHQYSNNELLLSFKSSHTASPIIKSSSFSSQKTQYPPLPPKPSSISTSTTANTHNTSVNEHNSTSLPHLPRKPTVYQLSNPSLESQFKITSASSNVNRYSFDHNPFDTLSTKSPALSRWSSISSSVYSRSNFSSNTTDNRSGIPAPRTESASPPPIPPSRRRRPPPSPPKPLKSHLASIHSINTLVSQETIEQKQPIPEVVKHHVYKSLTQPQPDSLSKQQLVQQLQRIEVEKTPTQSIKRNSIYDLVSDGLSHSHSSSQVSNSAITTIYDSEDEDGKYRPVVPQVPCLDIDIDPLLSSTEPKLSLIPRLLDLDDDPQSGTAMTDNYANGNESSDDTESLSSTNRVQLRIPQVEIFSDGNDYEQLTPVGSDNAESIVPGNPYIPEIEFENLGINEVNKDYDTSKSSELLENMINEINGYYQTVNSSGPDLESYQNEMVSDLPENVQSDHSDNEQKEHEHAYNYSLEFDDEEPITVQRIFNEDSVYGKCLKLRKLPKGVTLEDVLGLNSTTTERTLLFKGNFNVLTKRTQMPKKVDVLVYTDCVIIVGGSKIRLLSVEYLQVVLHVNNNHRNQQQQTDNNIVELFDSSIGLRILLKCDSGIGISDFIRLISYLTKVRKDQVTKLKDCDFKIFDSLKFISDKCFHFNFVSQSDPLLIMDPIVKSYKTNQIQSQDVLIPHSNTINKVLEYTFHSQQYWIVGGENGIFIAAKPSSSTVTNEWIKVANIHRVEQMLIIKNILLVLSDKKILFFRIFELFEVFKAPVNYRKEIWFFNLLSDRSIGILKAKNDTLYVLSVSNTIGNGLSNEIVVLDPIYDITRQEIQTFRITYEIPIMLRILNFKIFEKTLLAITLEGFHIFKLNYDNGLTCTVNYGFGFSKFPPFNEDSHNLFDSIGHPVDLIQLNHLNNICLLVYSNRLLICDKFGGLSKKLELNIGFAVKQSRFLIKRNLLILSNDNAIQIWKLQVIEGGILTFVKADTYLSRFVRLVSASDDLEKVVFRLSSPFVDGVKGGQIKPEVPLKDIYEYSNTLDNCQPELLLQL